MYCNNLCFVIRFEICFANIQHYLSKYVSREQGKQLKVSRPVKCSYIGGNVYALTKFIATYLAQAIVPSMYKISLFSS